MALIHKTGKKIVQCATIADYEHVININDNVHKSTGYLADCYHHYYNDAKSVPYVLEMDVCIFLQYFS